MPNRVIHSDNLKVLNKLPDESVDLIYIDPPFNTGRVQSRRQLKNTRNKKGDRTGFAGKRYSTIELGRKQYADAFDDYLEFIAPRLEEAYRVLKPNGSLYFHIDYREAHYVKVMLLDVLFGRDSFINEIIWAYDFGGRPKSRWPAKHDSIFLYAKNPKKFTFNVDDIDRIPYMAPGLVGAAKAKRGKLPTDVWWHTIVGTNSKEKTGYPTQKPQGIMQRIIGASSNEGDVVLDFFAGSGSTGEACLALDREFLLVDENPDAIAVMKKRFKGRNVNFGKRV
ncbi:MAG: DNA-methyltransferase [Planctomycetota bacterium]|jgi:site-specific DNA-methyltransferase (adenine-specific)